MSGNDRRVGQSLPRPVTKGHEMEGRAGDPGLRGKDGTCQGLQRAPERPHGGAASRVWTLWPVSSDGLLPGCVSVAVAWSRPTRGAAVKAARLVWASL